MNPTVQQAAIHLLQAIPAPRGVVNTLAVNDGNGPLIRVFVDPEYWFKLAPIPETFEGYRVSVEPRGKTWLF